VSNVRGGEGSFWKANYNSETSAIAPVILQQMIPKGCIADTNHQKKTCCGMKQKNAVPRLEHGQFRAVGEEKCRVSPEFGTLQCSAYLGSSAPVGAMHGGPGQPRHVWGLMPTETRDHARRVKGDRDRCVQGGLRTSQLPHADLGAGSLSRAPQWGKANAHGK